MEPPSGTSPARERGSRGRKAISERGSHEIVPAASNPDGQRATSTGADRLGRASGRQDHTAHRGYSGAISAPAFSPDGRRLVSARFR
jgi:WD40-like Beta Propeller Repeat